MFFIKFGVVALICAYAADKSYFILVWPRSIHSMASFSGLMSSAAFWVLDVDEDMLTIVF
jgi:hypothetical protein